MGRLRGVAGINYPEYTPQLDRHGGGPPRSREGRDHKAQAKHEAQKRHSTSFPLRTHSVSKSLRERFAGAILKCNRTELTWR